MLNQEVGDWNHKTIPPAPRIWVAGSGTNQAVSTALKFPRGEVIGSDISSKSLDVCRETASSLGVNNFELRCESINNVTYTDEFDYIICTGVIHHNAEPEASLKKLAQALKPAGIIELMVYNRYHRVPTSAFQKAVKILGEKQGLPGFDAELGILKKMTNGFEVKNVMSQMLNDYKAMPDAALADIFIQPVEHSYTVESLELLAESCGLEFVLPCTNIYDKGGKSYSWNLRFNDSELQSIYESLTDSRRWQVANLLLFERSPLLWFYLQRKDSNRVRKHEKHVCDEFLETVFVRAETMRKKFTRVRENDYELSQDNQPYPPSLKNARMQSIVARADGQLRMREILDQLGIETDFMTVNEIRLNLTTSAFPYLKATRKAGEGETQTEQQSREELLNQQTNRLNAAKRRSIN
jgi:SAM-dependent methyltransferase